MTFRHGQSGNPSGARPGPRFGRAALERAVRTHVAPVIDELVERTVEAALKGDTGAAAALVNAYSTAMATSANKGTGTA